MMMDNSSSSSLLLLLLLLFVLQLQKANLTVLLTSYFKNVSGTSSSPRPRTRSFQNVLLSSSYVAHPETGRTTSRHLASTASTNSAGRRSRSPLCVIFTPPASNGKPHASLRKRRVKFSSNRWVVAVRVVGLVEEVTHSPIPPLAHLYLTRRALVFLGGIVPLE